MKKPMYLTTIPREPPRMAKLDMNMALKVDASSKSGNVNNRNAGGKDLTF